MKNLIIISTSIILTACHSLTKNEVMDEYRYSDGTILYFENKQAEKTPPKKFNRGDKIIYYVEYKENIPTQYYVERTAYETIHIPITIVKYVLPIKKKNPEELPIVYVY